MSTDEVLALVVEPPLSVANSVLDAARRLAADLDEKGGKAAWVSPPSYSAPLVIVRGVDPDEAADAVGDRLKSALQTAEECPVQLASPVVETVEGPQAGLRIVSRVTTRSGELARMAELAATGLTAAGLAIEVRPVPSVALAAVQGDAEAAIATDLLREPKDVPIAGWLLGGLALARCSPGPGGTWMATRLRFLPLRRMGAKRDS
jgi:hypothetical protein